MYTLGSLFTGIGGIDLAFQRAGFDIAFQVEIDDYCNRVLERHWPNVTRRRDVRECSAANLPAVDVLAGGFPCQDISAAGKGAGIKEGNRSGLWFEFARLIGEIRPRFVLLENVAAIVGRDGDRVIADLTALGYGCEWGVIPASAVGAPHRRERWWCVAYSAGSGNCGQNTTTVTTRSKSYSEAIRRQPEYARETNTTVGDSTSARLERSNGRKSAQPQPSRSSYGSTQSLMGRAVDGLSRQLDSHRWPARPGNPQHSWEATREITTKRNNRASRIKALGNAVVPACVQPIAEAIYSLLAEADQGASSQESV